MSVVWGSSKYWQFHLNVLLSSTNLFIQRLDMYVLKPALHNNSTKKNFKCV